MTETKRRHPIRGFRVSDIVWQQAQETADRRDENLSAELRKFLTEYINRPDPK